VAVQGSFYSTGQRCTASSRIIVTQGIHDKFVSRLAERARALVVGDARDPKTQIGPVVDARQLEQDERYISIGKDEGARLLAGVDYHVPFGGRKGSSYGPREQGRYAVEFYTTVKTAYTLA